MCVDNQFVVLKKTLQKLHVTICYYVFVIVFKLLIFVKNCLKARLHYTSVEQFLLLNDQSPT